MKFDKRIQNLVNAKRVQTKDKINKEGLLDEDDYGRFAPDENNKWQIIPNHADGSFYGMDGWKTNFCDLMQKHPVYIDKNDAFCGRWSYFMSKMRPNLWNLANPYTHLKENIEKYDIICGIGYDAHFSPDYEMGIKLGWSGLIDKINYYKEKHKDDQEKAAFYNAHLEVIEAVKTWIKNHNEALIKMISAETDSEIKTHLQEMYDVNDRLLYLPPSTFREACQWIIWYHLASRTYNRDGAGGQLDTLLYPFYANEKALGTLDDETAIYYLSCFLINDPIYWQLGGPDAEGKDMTNKISYLILEAAAKINTSLNLTIRVHDKLDPVFFQKSVEYLIQYKNAWPRYSGDSALVKGFMKNGFSQELARKRIAVGCNWMSLPGLEYTMNDLVKINLAKVFEVAYEEMMDQKDHSTNTLWDLFVHHLQMAVQTTADGIRHHLKYQHLNEPELVLNMLSHGPIEKGLDVSNGGATFYNLAIDGAGLATVADSFAALEQRIEKEKKLTWELLYYYLKDNFNESEGERIRSLLQGSDRYGTGNTLGDKWAKKITDTFTPMIRNQSDPKKGHLFIPGWFSWANTMGFGKQVKATPNGRKAGEPISHGANPHPGFALDGAATRLAKAIAMVQPGYGNTAPMQLELDPSLAHESQLKNVMALIKGHFELGGTLLNINIMDKEALLDAHKDPSKYPDLVVRVTGFTAYFAMLTKEFRQLVVDRILVN